MMEQLFSYGTLQQQKVQLELFGRVLKGSRDVLNGYAVNMIEIRDEDFLSNAETNQQKIAIHTGNQNDKIEGTVFEVTYEELLLADQYEPVEYRRIEIVLESQTSAWLYAK
jgi:hypothetical protein